MPKVGEQEEEGVGRASKNSLMKKDHNTHQSRHAPILNPSMYKQTRLRLKAGGSITYVSRLFPHHGYSIQCKAMAYNNIPISFKNLLDEASRILGEGACCGIDSDKLKIVFQISRSCMNLPRAAYLTLSAQSDTAAKQSEVNLLMDEVEWAQSRLLSLEREKGLLRSQLETTNEENGNKSNMDLTTIPENSLSAKEKIISDLNMELHNMETTLSNEREEHMNEMKKLNALIKKRFSLGKGNIADVGVEYMWIPSTCVICNSDGHKEAKCPKTPTTGIENVMRGAEPILVLKLVWSQ
ncbi:hypothetical protein IFM89_022127 [Coptis chinensis]|uniref:Uncharacterized protein n=1 Tax=Coptis chinensis TaxID=261450 RepID=A0A835H1Z9_9MAGN|nr:hypothetical protein IFM89_022127 [Coptis chinensis]